MIVKYIASIFFFCLIFVGGGVAAKDFERIAIDRVWTGTPAGFAALDTGKTVYIAYYRPNRHMTVAAYDKNTGALNYRELDNVFHGWDAHNGLALGIDPEGRLHIAGNMHASPLIYGRMETPHDLSSLTLINRMTGKEEAHVTYPQFLHLADGRLLFLYRFGSSGHGRQYINAWDGKQWTRWLDTPLFSYDAGSPRSAYPTLPVRDDSGIWHMAWVWRTTPDAATNCCLSYARSPDLRHWEDAAGRKITLPIELGEGTEVDTIPVDAGLLNNVKLSLTGQDGAPIISYQKQDESGHTQIYNALLADSAFRPVVATRWKTRWMPHGGGSLNAPIGFSDVQPTTDGRLWQIAASPEDGRQAMILDPRTLVPLSYSTQSKLLRDGTVAAQFPPSPAAPLPQGMRWITAKIPQEEFSASATTAAYIRWPSYPSHRDRPRECTPEMPQSCHPPALFLELLLP